MADRVPKSVVDSAVAFLLANVDVWPGIPTFDVSGATLVVTVNLTLPAGAWEWASTYNLWITGIRVGAWRAGVNGGDKSVKNGGAIGAFLADFGVLGKSHYVGGAEAMFAAAAGTPRPSVDLECYVEIPAVAAQQLIPPLVSPAQLQIKSLPFYIKAAKDLT